MRKQWAIVGILVGLLTAGAVIGVRLAPHAVEVGSRIPPFTAVDITTGDSVALASFEGSVVLLNIWATWCEPCRAEMPSMQRLYESFGPQGLKVVAVSVDQADVQVVRDFQREYGLTFDILQDRSRAIERVFQTTGVPESFVLDREGTIRKRVIGAHDWASVANQDLVRRLLARRR
jgi:cytochrome c biogenesis protein CcmG/thiol:disulfide interchange protein DsbE